MRPSTISINRRTFISTTVKRFLVIAALVIASILVVATVRSHTAHAEAMAQLSQSQQETTKIKSQLEATSVEKSKLQVQSQATTEKLQQLEKENADLKAKKQARLDALKLATRNAQVRVVAVNGSCSEWLAQAGVTDMANAMELIRRESGCSPMAVNKSSGACGVAQELPCGKSGCNLGDGACQVAWMKRYVEGRYGSWANAIAFHNSNNWY